MSKIILINPKYPANLGAIVRIASAFSIEEILYTGSRLRLNELERIPRELRMKEYVVSVRNVDRPFDSLGDCVPVAVEFLDQAENLHNFEHPEQCAYVFGPEDGSIPSHILKLCHRFVKIPTKHCLNIATAVAIVAYDKVLKNDSSLQLQA